MSAHRRANRSRRISGFWLALTVITSSSFCYLPTSTARATGVDPLRDWTIAATPSPIGSWSVVDFVNGQWIALGHTPDVAVSTDSTTWQEYPVPAGSWQSVAYGDGQYVALSSVVAISEEMVSTDGTNWTALPGPVGEWTSLEFDQGRLVAVGSLGEIVTSTDGQQWTQVWHHSQFDLTAITYGSGHFVAVDSAVGATLISPNGNSWSLRQPIESGLKWGAVDYGNGTFVAFDDSGSGYVATSVYGYLWALHRYSPAENITGAAFGCGSFVASGEVAGSSNSLLSSSSAASWSAAPVPTDPTANWDAVAYGAHRFVAVDSAGDIAWAYSDPDCAETIPTTPRQVSGNVSSGEIWTYMHPSAQSGGAPVDSYRVSVTNGSSTRQCPAPVSFQPNCIIKGLVDHEVYWVTAQARNSFGFSAYTDPEFVIPVARWSLSAITTQPVISQAQPGGCSSNWHPC